MRPRPEPRDGEVLVRIRASALNRADLLQRQGRYSAPPGAPDSIPGLEIAGEVVAVGKGKILESGKVLAIDLKVGDRVLFGKYSGQTVKVEGEELLVMREEDIMGVVE